MSNQIIISQSQNVTEFIDFRIEQNKFKLTLHLHKISTYFI